MSRMSVSEAARQAGISRQYFYTKFIKTGDLTVSVDENGNKYIDQAELLRACNGRLPWAKPPSTVNDTLQSKNLRHTTPEITRSIDGLQVEVQLLREQLQKSEEREQRLLGQVDRLTDTIKQIEHRPISNSEAPAEARPKSISLWKLLTTPIRLRSK